MLPFAIAGLLAFILCGEAVLWMLFRRQINDMSFPRSIDTSFFRFFTMTRMRIIAVLHAATLAGVCVISLLALW